MTAPSHPAPGRVSTAHLAVVQRYVGELSFLRSAPATIDKISLTRLLQMAEQLEAILTDCAVIENANKVNSDAKAPSEQSFSSAIAADTLLAAAFNESDAALRPKLRELLDQWDEAMASDTQPIIPLVTHTYSLAVRTERFLERKLLPNNERLFRRFAPWITVAIAMMGGLIIFAALYKKYEPVTLSNPTTLAGSIQGVTATYYKTQDFQSEVTRQHISGIRFRTGPGVPNLAIKTAPYSVQLEGMLTFTPKQLKTSDLWYICVNHDDDMSLQIDNRDVITDKTGINARTVCRRLRITDAGAYPFTLKYATPDMGMELSLLWGDQKKSIAQIPNAGFLTAALEKQPVQDR